MNKVLSQAIKKAVSEFSPVTQENHLDKRPLLGLPDWFKGTKLTKSKE